MAKLSYGGTFHAVLIDTLVHKVVEKVAMEIPGKKFSFPHLGGLTLTTSGPELTSGTKLSSTGPGSVEDVTYLFNESHGSE